MSKRHPSTKAAPRGCSKPFYRRDLCRSKISHVGGSLKPGPATAPTSQNIIDSNLASATDAVLGSTCGDLYKAISSGNPDDIIKLTGSPDGKNYGLQQTNLDQALLVACSRGRKLVVQYLLLRGASTETSDPLGYTPLLVSVEKGFVDIARLLLDKGADVNASNIRGDSALTLSVRTCGSKDMIGLLLDQKSVNINHRNKDGYTCWLKAVEALNFDALKLLIKSGNDIDKDVNDCNGQINKKLSITPETDSQAKKGFNVDAIISLLEREAKGSKSSLRLAVFQRDLYSTRYLIDYGIYDSGINSDKELLIDFLEDIEAKRFKQCPVIKTELEIIRKLLEIGAGVFLKMTHRADILVVAVNIGSYELVNLLCQHGANMVPTQTLSPANLHMRML